MIIRSIEIENFGHFHNWKLENLGPGVNSLVGANEFGKTTLLEFIRRIFWGFPDRRSCRNLYPALSGRGAYGGRLRTELASGELLTIERFGESRGGALRLIRGDGRVSESQADLDALFGVDEGFYRNVYAITVDELSELRLLDREEIRSRLYGAGIVAGPLSLSALGNFFDRNAAELCTLRGRRHEIARLRESLSREEEVLAGALAYRADYEEAVRRGTEARRERAHLMKQVEEKESQLVLARRRAEALRLRKLLCEAEAELAAVPPLPEGFAADSATLESRLAAGAAAARSRQERIAEELRRMESRPRDPLAASTLTEREPELLSLEQGLGRFQQAEKELRRCEESVGPLHRRCGELEAELSGVLVQGMERQPVNDAALAAVREFQVRRASLKAHLAAGFPGRSAGAWWCLVTLLFFLAGVGFYAWSRDFRPLLLVALPAAGWMLHRWRRAAVEPEYRRLQRELSEFRSKYGIVPEVSPDELSGVLERLSRRQALERELAERTVEAARLRRELEEFRAACARFDGAGNLPPAEGVVRVRKQLEEVRRVKLRETIAAERLRDLRRELEQARSERETGEQALVAFYRKLGVAGHAEFLELLKRERLRVELSARVAARRADFEASGDSASEECPAEPDPAVLEREREELSRAVAGCDARIGAAESDAERLRQLSDGSGAALRVESLRGEIKAAAREYLIWSEARALLDRAIARYEKERQPELIRRAAGLFRQFTAGRYDSLRKSLAGGELLVTDSSSGGREKSVGELSRGTLGVLMIALRLALIECREREREPLPIVLDDVLVDFDPVRCAAVRGALEEFASNRQILLFGNR